MLSFYEIARFLGLENEAKKFNNQEISSVEFDSRKVQEKSLFVPIDGATKGTSYLNKAIENGSTGTLWPKGETLPENISYLVVENPLEAMQKIAQGYLAKIAPKVVGITGSNGKTTTKDMTENVLKQKFQTYKTQGNFNNNIGLPYTILKMPEKTEVLVLEMGMDHQGEIDFLSRLASPDACAITLIGESHLEYFKDRSGIAEAKMEIVNGLKEDGFLIVPGDEPLLTPLIKKVSQDVVTFSLNEGKSDIWADIINESQHEISFTLNFFPDETFTIPVSGKFNVKNALVAAYFGKRFGLTKEEVKTGLKTVSLTKNRSEWLNHKNMDILADVYNANPTAMSLVLESFSQFKAQGKKVIVLGDMLELGNASREFHENLSELILPENIQEVFLYGEEMGYLAEKLKAKYQKNNLHYYHKAEKEALENQVLQTIASGDLILLKASNGMHLNDLVEKIMSL